MKYMLKKSGGYLDYILRISDFFLQYFDNKLEIF